MCSPTTRSRRSSAARTSSSREERRPVRAAPNASTTLAARIGPTTRSRSPISAPPSSPRERKLLRGSPARCLHGRCRTDGIVLLRVTTTSGATSKNRPSRSVVQARRESAYSGILCDGWPGRLLLDVRPRAESVTRRGCFSGRSRLRRKRERVGMGMRRIYDWRDRLVWSLLALVARMPRVAWDLLSGNTLEETIEHIDEVIIRREVERRSG